MQASAAAHGQNGGAGLGRDDFGARGYQAGGASAKRDAIMGIVFLDVDMGCLQGSRQCGDDIAFVEIIGFLNRVQDLAIEPGASLLTTV